MIKKYYFKVTVRFRTHKPITKIVEKFTSDKFQIEERFLAALRGKYKDEFHSMDLWELPETSPEVIEFKKQKPL